MICKNFKSQSWISLKLFKAKNVRTLFSPTRGTMSAETAVATKSKYLINSFSGSLNLVCNACINLNPIPHPQSSLNGYSQSLLLGSNTATASGIDFSGKW